MAPPQHGESAHWPTEARFRPKRRATDRDWSEIVMHHVPADVAAGIELEMEQVA